MRVDADKGRALAGAGLLLGTVLWPVRQNWRTERRDGFPLSYYPMFSAQRRRSGTVVHLVGVDAAGAVRVLPHTLVGTGGLNQVRRQVAREVKEGRAAVVAGRAVDGLRRQGTDLVEVRVVSGTYRYDDFFAGRRTPVREVVHAVRPVASAARGVA